MTTYAYGIAIGIAFGVLFTLLVTTPRVSCFEDEIVAWDGDAHTVCVNLDEVEDYYATTF